MEGRAYAECETQRRPLRTRAIDKLVTQSDSIRSSDINLIRI